MAELLDSSGLDVGSARIINGDIPQALFSHGFVRVIDLRWALTVYPEDRETVVARVPYLT
jgi:hypothetical protein